MAADADPRLEPTYVNRTEDEMQFGGINTEQLYNKKNDKIRLLHMQHGEGRGKDTDQGGTHCDFEGECPWTWRKDIANGFYVATGGKLGENETGPRTDADNREFGKFFF